MISITLNCTSVAELHKALRALLPPEDRITIAHDTRAVTATEIANRALAMSVQPTSTKPVVDMLGDQDAQVMKPAPKSTPLEKKAEPKLEPQAATAAEEKPKRTRRTKAQIAADEAAQGVSQPANAEQDIEDLSAAAPAAASAGVIEGASDAPVTKEQVHQALQSVNINVNLAKAREILQKFNVNRISEIKPENFKAFVDTCNEAVMMHG